MAPHQLFPHAQQEIPTAALYTTTEQYDHEISLLSSRFDSSRTIAGTHRLHCSRPLSAQLVEVRELSNSLHNECA